jgi:nucleotide sugar dehydrogenase
MKSEHIDTAEKRSKYTVTVVGCGRSGLVQACLFADAGYRVLCTDLNQTSIAALQKGRISFAGLAHEAKLKNHLRTRRIGCVNDMKSSTSQSDVTLITCSAEVSPKGKADNSLIERVCRLVGSGLRHGSLIIVTGISSLGATKEIVEETLENVSGFKHGADFGIAYCPFVRPSGEEPDSNGFSWLAVSSTDERSRDAAATLLKTVTNENVAKTENVRAVEAAALFSLAWRNVTAALMNELASLCEKVSVDCWQTQSLMHSAIRGQLNDFGLHDEAYSSRSSLLLDEAEDVGARLKMLFSAREANEEALKHAVNLARGALSTCGRSLRRAKICLLGSTWAMEEDSSANVVVKIAKIFHNKGARVNVYDPFAPRADSDDAAFTFKPSVSQAAEGVDCVVVASNLEQFRHLNLRKLKVVMKSPAAMVDLEGILDPDKVEKEGFTYRGLGRGERST